MRAVTFNVLSKVAPSTSIKEISAPQVDDKRNPADFA